MRPGVEEDGTLKLKKIPEKKVPRLAGGPIRRWRLLWCAAIFVCSLAGDRCPFKWPALSIHPSTFPKIFNIDMTMPSVCN